MSGSKNGTLYAFDDVDGDIVWSNPVISTPVTPAFAGFGLFNGAISFADGRIFAALYRTVPARRCSNDASQGCTSDAQCPGGTCPPEPKHLMAFDVTNGSTVWEEEIGRSWCHVAVVNGVVYAGTQDADDETGASSLFAHDAATGARLATFPLPVTSTARAAVVGDTLITGYGELGSGGIRALSLCGNGAPDAGEACDPGGNACCSAACRLAVSVAPSRCSSAVRAAAS